ncbi:hypothetical protein CBR_g38961 [Chara braunii]|uniref:Vps72/YL1 C-terminal domain-containing protein n=1 Tax=Chara braunii TaxID=69332 RepID=A0A388K0Q8_CHABU|nr:hypothetical protein CBR_g38961 [Chara braunii]|eukprot:GBG63650.1 hypothetical protein CBR_g38961 [Chara braunii]
MGEEDGRRLPARSTRGKRLTKVVVEEELQADEAFWNQDAFQDDDVDDGYKTEEEVVDEFDSDFDASEPDGDDDDGAEAEEDSKRRKENKTKLKVNVLRKPAAGKKKKDVLLKRKGVAAKLESGQKMKHARTCAAGEALAAAVDAVACESGDKDVSGETGDEDLVDCQLVPKGKSDAKDNKPETGDGMGGVGASEEKATRKSTRTAVVVKAAERERERARAKVTAPARKRKEAATDDRKLTQEEMLHEAAQTEIMNLQSLEIMLAREEEVKKKAIIQKETYTGPLIRFYSRGGINVLEFTKVHSLPAEIQSKAPPYPRRSVCIITGLPAKYKDPKTGLPYATKEAFQLIRERGGQGGLTLANDRAVSGSGAAGAEGRRQGEGSREMPTPKRRVKSDRGGDKPSSGKTKQSKGKQPHVKSGTPGGDRSGLSPQSAHPLSSPIHPVHLDFRCSPPANVASSQVSSREADAGPMEATEPAPGPKAGAEGAAGVPGPDSQTVEGEQASVRRVQGSCTRRPSLDNRPMQRSELTADGDVDYGSDRPLFHLSTPAAAIAAPGAHMFQSGEGPLRHANAQGEGARYWIDSSSLMTTFPVEDGGEGCAFFDSGMNAGRSAGSGEHNALDGTWSDSQMIT